MVIVRAARTEDVEPAVAVLVRLPDHFTPDTHDEVRAAWPAGQAWVAWEGDEVVGFVLVDRRHPAAAEITFAAVMPERHGTGIGTALVDAALDALEADGVRLVEVKTLDATAGYEPYVATRAFWEHGGFHQVDRIDPLPGWHPGNPAAIYVAALTATR
jgi:GNAT superfamily N-acetyltransferase